MDIVYEQDGIVLIHADSRDVLKELPNTFTSCVTDPPYALEFMGKGWDKVLPPPDVWQAILRSLKPGASMLSFGGTRTFHRLTCAIEDAGFDIRDCLMWLYGTGFPKGQNISVAIDRAAGAKRRKIGKKVYGDGHVQNSSEDKLAPPIGTFKRTQDERAITAPATEAAELWEGYNTALKPAWEPIVLAMKATDGTFAQNAQEHGVAGINIGATRIGTDVITTQGAPKADTSAYGDYRGLEKPRQHTGRWPANVILDDKAAAQLDEQSGKLTSPSTYRRKAKGMNRGQTYGEGMGQTEGTESVNYGDTGGASRFFYCAKASKAERGKENKHPTVKPLKLMEYLLRLVTMPGENAILDPFAGSGTTLLAARKLGLPAVGIELSKEYCEIAKRRLEA